MKSLKEHKVQILAAIALAFSLGLVVPSSVFASGEMGVVAQAETSVSVQQLLDVINQASKMPNYDKYKALVNAYNGLTEATPAEDAVSKAVTAVKALVTDAPVTNESSAAAVAGYISGQMPQYTLWAPVINAINAVMKVANVTSETAITAEGLKGCTPMQIAGWYNDINDVVNPIPATYAENIVVLAGRVANKTGKFADYWKYEGVIAAALAVEAKPSDATLKVALAEQVKTVLGVEGADSLNTEALMAQVKGIVGYDKYVALYKSMTFVREALPEGVTDVSKITADLLTKKYPVASGVDPLVNYYTDFATAASVIDPAVMNNLIKLPTTSIPGDEDKPDDNKDNVNTPNTGIVGLFESGALDLGMVTLIASVAVASVAGLGLIAKLYLKKKF